MYSEVCRLADPRLLGAWWQEDFTSFLKSQGDLRHDENVGRLVERILSRHQGLLGLIGVFWRFEHFEAVVDAPEFRESLTRAIRQSDRTPMTIFRLLVEHLVHFSGCRRACVKFPVDIAQLPALLAAFPEGKIVHISRDPRAMAMSKTNDPGGTAVLRRRHPRLEPLIRPTLVVFAAWQYIRSSRVHRRYKHLPNYELFLYEDLMLDPAATMKRLCDFVGLPFSPDKLHLERGRHRQQRSSLTGEQTPQLDPQSALRWQTAITPFERWVVTSMTRRSMSRFGYDPHRHPIFQRSSGTTGMPPEPRSDAVAS